MENNGRMLGVDFSEFTEHEPLYEPVNGLLYYKNAILTDKYYIKNVYIWKHNKFVNFGEHLLYVMGEVNKGDYLTTCPIYGVAMKTEHKDIAFACVTSSRVPCDNFSFPVIGGCFASFL